MHLQRAWNESDRAKTPCAPHRNDSTTRLRSSVSNKTTMFTSRWRSRISLTKRIPLSGSSEKLVLISRTSNRLRSNARTTSSGVAAAVASKRLLRSNASTRSWQLIATASATSTLVLRTELETDSNRNSTHTSKCVFQKRGGTPKFYPQLPCV